LGGLDLKYVPIEGKGDWLLFHEGQLPRNPCMASSSVRPSVRLSVCLSSFFLYLLPSVPGRALLELSLVGERSGVVERELGSKEEARSCKTEWDGRSSSSSPSSHSRPLARPLWPLMRPYRYFEAIANPRDFDQIFKIPVTWHSLHSPF
jgi:hypothetical protein